MLAVIQKNEYNMAFIFQSDIAYVEKRVTNFMNFL